MPVRFLAPPVTSTHCPSSRSSRSAGLARNCSSTSSRYCRPTCLVPGTKRTAGVCAAAGDLWHSAFACSVLVTIACSRTSLPGVTHCRNSRRRIRATWVASRTALGIEALAAACPIIS
jgi:hypothetical protein